MASEVLSRFPQGITFPTKAKASCSASTGKRNCLGSVFPDFQGGEKPIAYS